MCLCDAAVYLSGSVLRHRARCLAIPVGLSALRSGHCPVSIWWAASEAPSRSSSGRRLGLLVEILSGCDGAHAIAGAHSLLCGRDRIAVVSGLSARRIFFSCIHRWMRSAGFSASTAGRHLLYLAWEQAFSAARLAASRSAPKRFHSFVAAEASLTSKTGKPRQAELRWGATVFAMRPAALVGALRKTYSFSGRK